jgi:type II secretory pathway pseudopilin PulG
MPCVNHPEREAVSSCNHCARSFCAECLVPASGEQYCRECVQIKPAEAKPGWHSPSLAAVLSFCLAGLGQFYNGQPGKGAAIFLTSWLIVPWVIGIFDAYNVAKKIRAGETALRQKPGCLIAFVLGVVVFAAVLFFTFMVAAIAIPNILSARKNANEAAAQETVKLIAQAAENYRRDNSKYPLDEYSLTGSKPQYLSEAYNNRTSRGYAFREEFTAEGYRIIAVPAECGASADKIFIFTSGAGITSLNCQQEAAKDEK